MRRRELLILALGLAVIALPLFFERLHSDEVIYWEVARNISRGLGLHSETSGGGLFIWHMPLPFYIVAPFLRLSAHIFTARAVSSAFTIACAVLVFRIARKDSGEDPALIASILFLLSFQALRFGGRYYLDQYGLFFFLLTLYLAGKGRFIYAGASAVLAIAAREYWFGVYPFLLLYAAGDEAAGGKRAVAGEVGQTGVKTRPPVFKGRIRNGLFLALPAVVVAAVVLLIVFSDRHVHYNLIRTYVLDGAAYKNIIVTGAPGYLSRLARGWAEFALVNAVAVAGFFASSRRGKHRVLLLVIPQVVLVSLVHGFAVSGGVTQYPMAVLATLCAFSGTGLKRLYGALSAPFLNRYGFLKASLAISCAQFLALNVLSTAVTLHKNTLVWGLGYRDDREVISILRRSARGESINGFWGAFVDDRRSWDWTDFHIDKALEKDPDWLVTFSNYVDILPQKNGVTQLEVYNIGPYVMIHSLKRGGMKEAVRQRYHPRWAFRKD